MADKIIIGCALPAGIVLHLEREIPENAPVGTPVQRLQTVTLNGTAAARAGDHDGTIGFHPNVAARHGLTEVDADFWAAWKAQEERAGTSKLLESGTVFESGTVQKAKSEAKERAQDEPPADSLDPINPKKSGMGKNVAKEVTEAEKTE